MAWKTADPSGGVPRIVLSSASPLDEYTLTGRVLRMVRNLSPVALIQQICSTDSVAVAPQYRAKIRLRRDTMSSAIGKTCSPVVQDANSDDSKIQTSSSSF